MTPVSLKRVITPLVEPISVEDAKLYSKIPPESTIEDSLVSGWIAAARSVAENYQRRSFITQQWRLTFDSFPSQLETIYLPRGPLQNLVSVTCVNSDEVETSVSLGNFNINIDNSSIKLKSDVEWPDITLGFLKIIYQTGYGLNAASIPANVIDAMYIYINYRYDNRLGETDVIPRVFYQLLDDERLFCGLH
jgi:uncharacterized phiE125 gp8 family phage protein